MNITRRSIEGKKRPNLACTPYLASRLESGLGVSPRLVPFQFFFFSCTQTYSISILGNENGGDPRIKQNKIVSPLYFIFNRTQNADKKGRA
jgi:hypothetical protein